VSQRITVAAQAKLGVPVTLGRVRWQLFPPALVVEDAATVQPQPIRFRRLVAQPNVGDLLRRKLSFDHVLVEGGVMPQLALRGLHVVPAPPGAEQTRPVAQLRFRDLTWITRHGKALEFDGNVAFDAGWRPRSGVMERPGVQPAAQLALEREAGADRWQVRIRVGGGTADGVVEITPSEGGLRLSGKLEPRGIEVQSGMAAFKRNSVVRGKASGHTVLSAHGKSVGELARSLHTRTDFTIAQAVLLRMDVDKAVRTVGADRSGETALKSLAGRLDTQNTPDGMEVRYSAIQARGDTFSASGAATVIKRQISAEVTVDPDGVLPPIPLTVAGPLGAPKVSFTPVAVARTAIGGVGSAIGKLFGKD
jgi:hypothetical protein